MEFNIYCDESTHLENDRAPFMVLGAVWCPRQRATEIASDIKAIKVRHGLPTWFELKWTKVTPSKVEMYIDLVEYFFSHRLLCFRGLVARKGGLDHRTFGQSHDDWYYKMYFQLLRHILNPKATFRVFIDIKDTCSEQKRCHLRDVLCNNMFDFSREIVGPVQPVRSFEVQQIQLADVLIGALNYANRGLEQSEAKLAVVKEIQKRSGYSLTRSTLLMERKFNLFHWTPQGEGL